MQENFGADPLLVAEIGAAATLGMQGSNGGPNSPIDPHHLHSEAKHYVAYGAGSEDGYPADISLPTLHDIYLKPWKAYVSAGGRGAMAAHNSVNREPCHSSHWLLTSLFRGTLGCQDCLIGSDFYDVSLLASFGTVDGDEMAARVALEAGLDQDLGSHAYGTLLNSSRQGLVNMSHIDRATGNVLRAKFAAGLFERPMSDPSLLMHVNSEAHRALALETAIDGITLLQNLRGVLPITMAVASKTNLAIIGPNGGCAPDWPKDQPCDAQSNAGGNYFPINGYTATQMSTVLNAAQSSDAFRSIEYARGAEIDQMQVNVSQQQEAVALAARSDITVLVLGDSGGSCGEGHDRTSLDLSGTQLQLLNAVLRGTKPTAKLVLVLVHGRTVTFGVGDDCSPNDADCLPNNDMTRLNTGNLPLRDPRLSLISAWLPGEMAGPAILSVLMGSEPGGRLNQPWPRSVGQIGARGAPWLQLLEGDCDECIPARDSDLFCLGAGLSYGNLTIVSSKFENGAGSLQIVGGGEATVMIKVKDLSHEARAAQGASPRKSVLQVYFAQTSLSRVARYRQMLGGFEKIELPTDGSAATVRVRVRASDLGYHVHDHANGGVQLVTAGAYRLWACFSACNCPLAGFGPWHVSTPNGGLNLTVT